MSPAGIEDVITNTKWRIKRTKTKKAWDNGGTPSATATDADDTSFAEMLDLDPKSGSSTREIYDLDTPGCSNTLPGTTVNHTAELYENFKQWAAVILNSEERCSDEKLWSYEARVDVDKANNKVELNKLRTSHITIPGAAHYATR